MAMTLNPGAVSGTITNGGYEITGDTGKDTITLSGTGAGVTLNSGAGLNYPNTIYSVGTTSITANPWSTESTMNAGKINLNGENADLVINGKSLTDTIAKLEERLNILNVNEKLESEWSELKELGDRYRELEAQITAKMATYESLKRYDPT